MASAVFRTLRSHSVPIAAGLLLGLLTVKFFLPYFRYPIPLGYDPGIHKFLFLKYAESFPLLPEIPRWAGEHPPGLFLIAAPFLRLGVPVDLFLGRLWNLMPVLVAVALAIEFFRREGAVVGVLVLLAALLSQAYYDGFVGMYWKTYASLLFVIFTFGALERKSFMAALFALLAFIIHHQTGLLLGLTMVTWCLISLRSSFRDRRAWLLVGALGFVALVSLLFYLPHWKAAVRDPFTSIYNLRGDLAPGGSFPDPIFYLRTTGILLALGVWGFVLSLRKEKGSLWQLAVLWTLPFILLRLVFYRRFFLQCDFFLLPFAAMGIRDLWMRLRSLPMRTALALLLLVQAVISQRIAWDRIPAIDILSFAAVKQAAAAVPDGTAPVIALDNAAAPWLLGELPDRDTGGPGIFDIPGWNEQQWGEFLYGTNDQRSALLGTLPMGTLFVETPIFTSYYGEHVAGFLSDPCLKRLSRELLELVCGK